MKNKKLSIVLLLLITVFTISVPTKKANAGVVFSAAMAPSGSFLILGGALMVGYGLIFAFPNPDYGPITGSMTLDRIIGATLIVLDEDIEEEKFETLPSYMLEEIEFLAKDKLNNLELHEGLHEVVFTQEEVDEIFNLTDEYSSEEEMSHLRDILTSRSL